MNSANARLSEDSHLHARDRLWQLDVLIAALAAVVLYLSVTQLRFDDPRPLYNAWTFAIGIPALTLFALSSRSLLSRYVHRSVQLGLLFSLLVHLLLLVLAVNVIIFSRYFPEAFTGLRTEQPVAKKTLPEYLFQPAKQTSVTPDWERPVDAESSARIVPEEPRQLLPVEDSAPRMELPKPRDQDEPLVQKHLMERSQPSESKPTPANSPTRLARRQSASHREPAVEASNPEAPAVPMEAERMQPNAERSVVNPQRTASAATSQLRSPSPSEQTSEASLSPRTVPSRAGLRSSEQQLPTVGDAGVQSERVRRTVDRIQPAGSSPAPPSIAVARVDESASRMISPAEVPWSRQGQSASAQIAIGTTAEPGLPDTALAGAAASRPVI